MMKQKLVFKSLLTSLGLLIFLNGCAFQGTNDILIKRDSEIDLLKKQIVEKDKLISTKDNEYQILARDTSQKLKDIKEAKIERCTIDNDIYSLMKEFKTYKLEKEVSEIQTKQRFLTILDLIKSQIGNIENNKKALEENKILLSLVADTTNQIHKDLNITENKIYSEIQKGFNKNSDYYKNLTKLLFDINQTRAINNYYYTNYSIINKKNIQSTTSGDIINKDRTEVEQQSIIKGK